MNEGLIFAYGRMLTASEAAAYIKELKEENNKLREEIIWLREANRTLQDEIWE